MTRTLPLLTVIVLFTGCEGTWSYRQLHQDEIIHADLWASEPRILSAYYAFDNIIGVDGEEAEVRAAGDAWNAVECTGDDAPERRVLTSSSTTDAVEASFDNTAEYADAIPVVFTWPVLPSTLDHTDFRVTLNTGETVHLTETGVDYAVAGGSIRVLGLADLGRKASIEDGVYYDDCYFEDHDNYIDVVLSGDEEAMRAITHLEIPATGDYDPLYNPGGPGNDPTAGVVYTAHGPPDLEPVMIALDDPMTVSYQK